jgi:hypothetical protein
LIYLLSVACEDYNRLQCPNILSRSMQICILCMGNIAEKLLLLSEGMLMLVLGQTENILNIYYDFFQYKFNESY